MIIKIKINEFCGEFENIESRSCGLVSQKWCCRAVAYVLYSNSKSDFLDPGKKLENSDHEPVKLRGHGDKGQHYSVAVTPEGGLGSVVPLLKADDC